MKVTSDRIKARAQQLRNNGFRLSGNMVRSTLELNAGARTLQVPIDSSAQEKTDQQANEPEENTEAA
jgi:hypothetical protein